MGIAKLKVSTAIPVRVVYLSNNLTAKVIVFNWVQIGCRSNVYQKCILDYGREFVEKKKIIKLGELLKRDISYEFSG